MGVPSPTLRLTKGWKAYRVSLLSITPRPALPFPSRLRYHLTHNHALESTNSVAYPSQKQTSLARSPRIQGGKCGTGILVLDIVRT
jgi:hypothetical protein